MKYSHLPSAMILLFATLIVACSSLSHAEDVRFEMGGDAKKIQVWARGREFPRTYFAEFLPGLFERTLVLDEADFGNGKLEWIFTGNRGGFTVVVEPSAVQLVERYYDSVGFSRLATVKSGQRPELWNLKPGKHYPEWRVPDERAALEIPPRTVVVIIDHKLQLTVNINGRTVFQRTCMFDVSRHQLRLTGKTGRVRGTLKTPPPESCTVEVDPSVRHQTMIGFGGIATPTAYAQLSRQGKRRWWELVCQYNLLIQREYPIGQRLNPEMDNWDHLEDATPHNYGNNFPNGEISDFNYNKTLRRLGGQVWFEFWALPPWATRGGTTDVEAYTRAMIHYCRTAKQRTGSPPDVVGIQNERHQPSPILHKMTLALRRALDEEGMQSVKIHMADAGTLESGIPRAKAFKESKEAWAAIDYAATHMYDYQSVITDPDRYDTKLLEWKKITAGKPFLSTELCANANPYQSPSYRLALSMGQLYHKNLVLADAAAICYCWTLLNVAEPSYGWTRTLCVPDPSQGFTPVAASHQLRVFGAFSRRIREGMARLHVASSNGNLLASAFADEAGRQTVVMLNRATRPAVVRLKWPGATFQDMEIVGPYSPNSVSPAPTPDADGRGNITIPPGAIVTLTSVPEGRLPDGFTLENKP